MLFCCSHQYPYLFMHFMIVKKWWHSKFIFRSIVVTNYSYHSREQNIPSQNYRPFFIKDSLINQHIQFIVFLNSIIENFTYLFINQIFTTTITIMELFKKFDHLVKQNTLVRIYRPFIKVDSLVHLHIMLFIMVIFDLELDLMKFFNYYFDSKLSTINCIISKLNQISTKLFMLQTGFNFNQWFEFQSAFK